MKKLVGDQIKELREAIIIAYPTKGSLEIIIREELEENLDAIAGGENLNEIVSNLIKWAEAKGKLKQLIEAVSNRNPDNPKLTTIKQKLLPSGSKPENLQINDVSKSSTFKYRLLKLLLTNIFGVTVTVLFLRFSAIFEPLELWFFDQMIGLQLLVFPPKEPQDENLLLIQITQEDINKYGRGKGASLSDETLSKLLEKLLENKPKVIGLDLYREFPADKGSGLENLLQTTPNLFAICKVADPKYNSLGTTPPPEVPKQRIGFSDLPEDVDSAVRRQLLRMDTTDIETPCDAEQKTMDSFSFKVAQYYLADKRKEYKEKNDIENLASGDVVLEKLYGRTTGGYQSTERLLGYQVLLNYRYVCRNDKSRLPDCSTLKIAPTINVQDALKDNFDKKLVENKIVLIGIKVDGIDTLSPTPFSSGGKEPMMPGLIMQAQMVSQLVSAVENGRSLLRVWSIEYEILWILVWSIIGGILVVKFRGSIQKLIVFEVVAFISLFFVCFIFLITPIKHWIPFVPPTLTLTSTGVVVFIQRKRI